MSVVGRKDEREKSCRVVMKGEESERSWDPLWHAYEVVGGGRICRRSPPHTRVLAFSTHCPPHESPACLLPLIAPCYDPARAVQSSAHMLHLRESGIPALICVGKECGWVYCCRPRCTMQGGAHSSAAVRTSSCRPRQWVQRIAFEHQTRCQRCSSSIMLTSCPAYPIQKHNNQPSGLTSTSDRERTFSS